jgi:alpha-beta hydrolase superfamily lysophospholipase
MRIDLHTSCGEWTSHDGVKLAYRVWQPSSKAPTRGVLLFHRGHEHGGRWEQTVADLQAGGLGDTAFFAWDQRGHGQSPGERGDAKSVAEVIRDAEFFARHVVKVHGIPLEDLGVVAHSVGAVIAAAWVHDYAPRIRGMVLLAPALAVRLYVPGAVPALRIKQGILGRGHVKSYVKAGMLTHDPVEAAAYRQDRAIFRQISVRMLLDLHDTGRRLVADAGAICAPTLLLMAGKDWVVDNRAQCTFYERLGSRVKQLEQFDGMYHGLLHEKERTRVVGHIGNFLGERFAQRPGYELQAEQDCGGSTRTEYDRLRLPARRKWVWGMQRGMLGSFGRMSAGIRVGHRSGFDSGVMLDYVYENKPRGVPLLGTMIDRSYLNSLGWRGIRARREHLELLLDQAITRLQSVEKPVRIVDIAAGAGRYVLGILSRRARETNGGAPITALLRDYQEVNLQAARQLAASLGLSGAVTIEKGDAFDRESLAGLQPRPTIAIVSGLYELFPENAGLRRSLAGLAAAIDPGGYLLYTCQPWHPQVEFIARVLTNREGKPWIMRRRTQGEMDELVRAAGFEKQEQLIDRWGIFTVSLAQRKGEGPS